MHFLKSFAAIALMLITVSSCAQAGGFLKDYFFRWENSKTYMIAVAQAMPDSGYGFKPVPKEMSFAEQMIHVCGIVDWQAQMLIGGRKEEEMPKEFRQKKFNATGKSKSEIIEMISKTFDAASSVIKKFSAARLEDKITYAGKTRTILQVFLLMSDHVTHHRAQMLVYLRLKGINPPEYSDYQ